MIAWRRLFITVGLVATLLSAGACGGKKKDTVHAGDLSADATFERATKLLAEHQLRQATAALKRIQFAQETRAEIEPLTRLALADATFYQGTAISWIDARNLYLDFVTLNGDHALAPYAQLQVGLCSLKQVSQPSKDQELTKQAIRDLRAVEQRWPDAAYTIASRTMLLEARANLAESEYLIGKFYFKKKNYTAAIERFRIILAQFPDFQDVDKVLFHMAQANAKNGNSVIARGYLDRLLSDYPSSGFLDPARKLLGSMEPPFQSDVVTEPSE